MPEAAVSIRAFNRFYSQVLGGTSRSYLGSGLSLPEARVLFEVATTPGCTAQGILSRVRLDQGHLSRIVARLARAGLLDKTAGDDRRKVEMRLTAAGRRMFRRIDQRADREAERLVAGLGLHERHELEACMRRIRDLLQDPSPPPALRVRRGRVGDLGWAFHRQAVIYREEFGYSPVFEAYVARGLPPFLDRFDARRDALWVAERGGLPLGCIAIQHDPERPGWAKLRWYFVERAGRGLGAGSRLLATALAFARRAGYAGVHLWTVNDLHAARRQYERAGFTLAFEDPKACAWAPWGREQRWEMRLGRRPERPRAGARRLAP